MLALILGKSSPSKYNDPGNPTIIVQMGETDIRNTLVKLGTTINIMTKETLEKIGITGLRLTPTVLELADPSTIHLEGNIEDVIISAYSWEYPINFLVLQPKTHLGGHSGILGRPWLAVIGAFIGCRLGFVKNFEGNSTKKLVLYLLVQPIKENDNPIWAKFERKEGNSLPLLIVRKTLHFKHEIEDDTINNFISNPPSIPQPTSQLLNSIMDKPNQEYPPEELFIEVIPTALSPKNSPIEIESNKMLNINSNLNTA